MIFQTIAPLTAIYTGAPASFLLEMSPPILSLLPAFPRPSFPSVCPAVGLAVCPGWGGGCSEGGSASFLLPQDVGRVEG